MQGLNRPGAHAHFKHSSFLHALVCYFRLDSIQRYIVAHVELESVSVTQTTATLPYSTQNIFSSCQVLCLTLRIY